MPIYSDPIGGSTGSICSVSPSDLVGQVDNLISRIEELEQKVNELSTQNVSANQLSDFSNQVGWVYGVTYLGVEGWTQTAAGTLIPPAGFTVSQILADAQARDQLGYSGVSAAVSDYLVVQPSTATLTGLSPNLSTILFSSGSSFDTSNLSSGQIDITESGYYHCSIHLNVVYSAAANVKRMTVSAIGAGFSVVDQCIFQGPLDNSNRLVMSSDFSFEASAGDSILITFSNITQLDSTYYASSIVSVEKLRSI